MGLARGRAGGFPGTEESRTCSSGRGARGWETLRGAARREVCGNVWGPPRRVRVQHLGDGRGSVGPGGEGCRISES